MPVSRINRESFSYNPLKTSKSSMMRRTSAHADSDAKLIKKKLFTTVTASNVSEDPIYYPITASERLKFRTVSGKKLTDHQWAVYDFTRTIPKGKITTYKEVSAAIGGSPRSVGNALRNNPFAPYVPCHRVIASSLFIGGFFGEWGTNDKTGTQCHRKLEILKNEGVHFSKNGHLEDSDTCLWRG